MSKLTGMDGNITVSATDYPVTEWSINVNDDVQDITDTGSNNWQEQLSAVKSAETTFTAFWGSATALLSTVFAIGTTVGCTLKIGNSGKTFAGSFVIKTFSVKNNCKSPVEFSCTGTSTGSITMPA